jgi:D-glycero-D-manno-heptose 1,7-bisphosphate phosphatase
MPSQYIFLDRDGTIIKDKHHMHKIKDIEFLPRALEGLQKLQSLGFQLIIISNQSGVTRGYFSKEEAEYFHKEVLKKLKGNNITIRDSLFCYHREEDGCSCRKPKTGLVTKAAKKFRINLTDSFFIGDKDCDIKLGRNCKGKTILIKNGQYKTTVKPDFIVNSLNEAHQILSAIREASLDSLLIG